MVLPLASLLRRAKPSGATGGFRRFGRRRRHVALDLIIIGLAIALEPLTLVAFILILSAEKGTRKGLAFILGWMACLVAVIAAILLVTGGKPPAPHTAPSTAALVVKAFLGAVLIWVG